MAKAEMTPAVMEKYDTILTYVRRNRDVTFETLPFSTLDYLIFAALSYIPLEEFKKANHDFKPEKLSDLMVDYLNWADPEQFDSGFPNWLKNSIYLAMGLLKTKRYQKVKVSRFAYTFDEEERCQFSALCFLLPDDTMVLAYRGTDNSINGWKEDFDLAAHGIVPGQKLSAHFLRSCIRENPEKKFILTGHSKGANFAVYAAEELSIRDSQKLIRVYSFDGPGLCYECFTSEGHQRIQDRIVHIVPKDDLIGVLLNHEEITMVVNAKPDGDLANQHNFYTWEISGNEFMTLPDRTPASKYIATCVNQWVNGIPMDKRTEMAKSFFTLVDAAGFTKANMIIDNMPNAADMLLFSFHKLSKPERKEVRGVLFSLVSIFAKNASGYFAEQKRQQALKQNTETKLIHTEG